MGREWVWGRRLGERTYGLLNVLTITPASVSLILPTLSKYVSLFLPGIRRQREIEPAEREGWPEALSL